jgi:hypothetical protein
MQDHPIVACRRCSRSLGARTSPIGLVTERSALLRGLSATDNAAMVHDIPNAKAPVGTLRWLRRILLLVVLPVACVVWLLGEANSFALFVPLCWTAATMMGCCRGIRRAKREAALKGYKLRDRRLPKWLQLLLVFPFAFFIFGWALFVGLGWGLVAGMCSLYLELVVAGATTILVKRAFDYCDKHHAASLVGAFLTQVRLIHQ